MSKNTKWWMTVLFVTLVGLAWAETGTAQTTTVTFDSPAPPGASGDLLNGVYQGIDFGTGQWRWEGPYNVDPTNHIYFDSTVGTSRTFQFAPAPQILESMQVFTTGAGTLTLSDDRGQTVTRTVETGALQLVTTGWAQASTVITVNFTSGQNLGIDDITYGGSGGVTYSGPAPSQVNNSTAGLNDSQEPGSVLVFPKFIRGTFADGVTGQAFHARTELEISVTCPKGATCPKNLITGKFQRVFLRAHWVCPGDTVPPIEPGTCAETSFDLETTVNGTLFFNPEGVVVVGNLITPAAFPNNATTTIFPPPCPEGYLIVWVTDGSGRAIKFDGLIGNAVIRDGTLGEESLSARAYNAIPIQAGPDIPGFFTTGDPTDLDGDTNLDFNGVEYKMVTGKIFGTVRYEDVVAVGGLVETHLTLLTLDVASNLRNPVTTVKLNFFKDNEDLVDESTHFVCWREQRLTEINLGLTDANMGRKGLVESTSAEQELDFFNTRPVTVLGIVETKEGVVIVGTTIFNQLRDYAYSLYNDSTPVPTTFEP